MRLAAILAAGLCAAQSNPYTSPAHVAEGKRLYRFYCVNCHGMDGASGRGARLASPYRRNGASDGEMFRTIAQGIPGTEMPGQWLTDDEVWKILTFVRTLENPSSQPCPTEPGSARDGAEVYRQSGCPQCHTMGGEGGRLGPDLQRIGAARSRGQLIEALVEPAKTVALRYQTIDLTTRDNRKLEGVVLAEDEYSVTILDRQENLRTFYRQELRSAERSARSLMPSYRSLGGGRLNDLASYLCSGKGGAK